MTDVDASPLSRTRRIGLFGGTFDPPHLGHLVAANEVLHRCELDEVWFVVAGEPWQKADTRAVTGAADRLAMVAALVEGRPGLDVSAVEVERRGPSYTADTVSQLERIHRDVEWLLVLGADAAAGIDTWERADELTRVRVIVVNRPGQAATVPAGFDGCVVEMPAIDLSSTVLRARLADGVPCDLLVPEGVLEVIGERGLYGAAPSA